MNKTLALFIDNKPVPLESLAMHHTLRFVTQHAGAVPVLYTDGKRETRAWRLVINHEEPKDPHGRSA